MGYKDTENDEEHGSKEYNQNFLLTIKSIQVNARFVCTNYTQYRLAKKSCNSKDLTCGYSQ